MGNFVFIPMDIEILEVVGYQKTSHHKEWNRENFISLLHDYYGIFLLR